MLGKDEFVRDLREMIRRGQVVSVVGSGVSIAATPHAPTWRGLIQSGVERCGALGASEAWRQRVLGLLEADSDPEMLLSAAELVHQRLHNGGEFARWLRETFRDLAPQHPSVIQLLAQLNLPLLTTNYDDLIEKVTSLKPVAWTDERTVARVIRGDDRRVLHLHGHWDDPESVVLGIRSYEAVKNNPHTQTVMRALAVTKSLLFVGCGDEGLADPNFGNFLTWLAEAEKQAQVEHRHYRLVRQQDTFPPRGRLFPLVYGADFGDLPRFIENLLPERHVLDQGEKKRTAIRVLGALPESVTYYLKRLCETTENLALIGMGRSLQVLLPIAEAYIPLQTTMARSVEHRPASRFKHETAEKAENMHLGEVFRKASQFGLRGVVLLGEPGSGRTTGARQLAWRLASRLSLPEDLGLPAGTTPVFLRFRNLNRETLAKKNGLRAFLENETRCVDAPDGLDSPGTDLWNGRGGSLLWILDGLDEVMDRGARQKVSGWIRRALENRPSDRFLVTCRFQGYFLKDVPLGPRFVEFHVRPFDNDQVEKFVRGWFAVAYSKLLGPGPRAEAQTQTDGNDLLDILARPAYQTGHIRELCTNPLLLTILCIVFHEERRLPTGRAELYAHCVRVLLEYWRRDLYQSDLGTELKPFDAEAAQAVLARVAWWMHQTEDRTAAPLDRLAAEAARGLAQVSPDSGLGSDGLAFLERMRDETGILAMTPGGTEGRCGFMHLGFQEYLAADHAVREQFASEIASVAALTWWREVVFLALSCATTSFATRFLDAADTFGSSSQLPVDLQLQVLDALGSSRAQIKDTLLGATKAHFSRVRRLAIEMLAPCVSDNELFQMNYILQDDNEEPIKAYVELLLNRDRNRSLTWLLDKIPLLPDPNHRHIIVALMAERARDKSTLDTLKGQTEQDPRPATRSIAGELLATAGWEQLEVRHHIRERAREDPSEGVRSRLRSCMTPLRKRLAGFWEALLLGVGTTDEGPQLASGYPAIRFTRFRLREIGVFSDTGNVPLNPHTNLLLGENSCGKTTILKCLAIAAVGSDAANEVEDRAASYLRKGADKGIIEVEFELIPDCDSFPEESGVFNIGLEIRANSDRFRPLPSSEMTIRSDRSSGPEPGNALQMLSTLRTKRNVNFGFVCGYGANRTFSESRFAFPPQHNKDENEWVLSLFRPDAWLINPDILSALLHGDMSKMPGAPQTRIDSQSAGGLREKLCSLLPGVERLYDQGIHDLSLASTDLRFGELSDGYRSLLACVGHLLRCALRCQNWNGDPTSLHGVALIDEIDLHLHPAWQKHVVSDLRRTFPNMQFIVSSHSPLVAGASPEHSIVHLKRNANRATPELIASSFQGWRADQILTSSVFGLDTSRDTETSEWLQRYRDLATKAELNSAEEHELHRLANRLGKRVPSLEERSEAREAMRIFDETLDRMIEEKSSQEKERIRAELLIRVLEAMTGTKETR